MRLWQRLNRKGGPDTVALLAKSKREGVQAFTHITFVFASFHSFDVQTLRLPSLAVGRHIRIDRDPEALTNYSRKAGLPKDQRQRFFVVRVLMFATLPKHRIDELHLRAIDLAQPRVAPTFFPSFELTHGGKRIPSSPISAKVGTRVRNHDSKHTSWSQTAQRFAQEVLSLGIGLEVLKCVLSVDCIHGIVRKWQSPTAIPEVDVRSRPQFQINPPWGRSVAAPDVDAAAVKTCQSTRRRALVEGTLQKDMQLGHKLPGDVTW